MSHQGQSWQSGRSRNTVITSAELLGQCIPTDEHSPSITFTPAQSYPSYPDHGDLGGRLVSGFLSNFDSQSQPNLQSNSLRFEDLSNQAVEPLSLFREPPPWNPQSITSHPTSTQNINLSTEPTFLTSRATVVRRPGAYPGWRNPPASNPEEQLINHGSWLGANPVRRGASMGDTEDWQGPADETTSYGDLTDATHGWSLNHRQNNLTHPGFSMELDSDALSLPSYTHHTHGFISPGPRDDGKKPSDRTVKKIHQCDIAGCERTAPFTSSNDLDRHKRTVHNIRGPRDKSWKCQGKGCKHPDKMWPRLDNFKNHCKSCHGKELLDDLIKRSELASGEASPQDANLDADLNLPLPSGSVASASQALVFPELSEGPDTIPRSAKGKEPMPVTISGAAFAEISKQQTEAAPALTRPPVLSMRSDPTDLKTGYMADSMFSADYTGFLPDQSMTDDIFPQSQSMSYISPPVTIHSIPSTILDVFKTNLVTHLTKDFPSDHPAIQDTESIVSMHIKQLLMEASICVEGSSPESQDTMSTTVNNVGYSGRSKQKQKCDSCVKEFDRPCDLKKHRKRHLRPWPCTFAEHYGRTFGSKADWKRHEDTSHFHVESYTCSEPSAPGSKTLCGKVFHRGEPYSQHLKTSHGFTSAKAQEKLKDKKMGFPGSYWCGFCRTTHKTNQPSEEFWNERFDHIEDHILKKGQSVSNWYEEGKQFSNGQRAAHTTVSPTSTVDRSSTGRPSIASASQDSLFSMAITTPTAEMEEPVYFSHTPRAKRPRADEFDEEVYASGSRTRNHNSHQWQQL